MKRYLTVSLLAVAFVSMLSFSGCILDALNNLTENIPVTQEFDISSSSTSYSQTETIDLSKSDSYQRFQNKIQSMSFLRAEYRTERVDPSDLQADVTITLADESNNKVLFTKSLGTIKPADYQSTPYELTLTAADISLINAYLSTLSNKVFQATISFTNVKSSNLLNSYTLKAAIDIVFQLKTS